MIQDPAGQKGTVEPQLEARGDSTYRCTYQPTMEGVHTVHVTFASVPIPRSPYTVTVGQGRPGPDCPLLWHCSLGLPQEGEPPGPVPLQPTPGRLLFELPLSGHLLSFLPCWGPSSSPLLAPLHLSPHAFTFGRARSSCLATCRSLLCPQGQRYLDLSSSWKGGRGALGWCVAGGRRPAMSWPRPRLLGSRFLPVLSRMSPSNQTLRDPPVLTAPTCRRQGRGHPAKLLVLSWPLCLQPVTRVPAGQSAGASSPRVCG